MEAVKLQPSGRHVISTGHNYSMPLTYGGWFEVLSEDGKAIEPASTVVELASLWPAECVVRESVRAIVCSGAKHDTANQHGSTRLDQTRTVMAGEWLALRDVVEATVESSTPSHVVEATAAVEESGALPSQTRQYLRCVDAVGDSVFLAMSQVDLLICIHRLRKPLPKICIVPTSPNVCACTTLGNSQCLIEPSVYI